MLSASPIIQAVYVDFDILTDPLTALELSCVEIRDNICTHEV